MEIWKLTKNIDDMFHLDSIILSVVQLILMTNVWFRNNHIIFSFGNQVLFNQQMNYSLQNI